MPVLVIVAFDECRIGGVNEIIHFDLTRFARKMENSKSNIFVPAKGIYRRASGRAVYHLHLVIKYQSDADTIYQHYRIVMTRSGIRRSEEIPVTNEAGGD